MKTEERKAYEKRWREKNRDRVNSCSRAYYRKHHGHMRKIKNAYERSRPDQIREYRKRWGPEIIEKKKVYNSLRQQNLKKIVVNAYGGMCVCCAENSIKFLTIDHVNRDGRQHRSSGLNVYSDLIKRGFPKEDFRLLCMNCNWAMRLGDACPHEIEIKKAFELELLA